MNDVFGGRQGPTPFNGPSGTWLRHVMMLLILLAPAQALGADFEFETTPLTIDSAAGRFAFEVELAATAEQRRQGLMFRDSLEDDHGMLFDFGRTAPVTMWMRNTYIPLDMLFIDADGQIRRIVENTQPLSDAVIGSGGPVRAVLELRGGMSAELGIQPGDQVVHAMFPAP
jgi:uncharacterized membrane protein (UPF0127 family)